MVQKYLDVTQGQSLLFHDYRYFFYLTNDRESSPAEIVFEANDRCNQENLHAQLKGAVRALHAPVDKLESNWAYMVMTALAWNLKAWWALSLPEPPGERGAARAARQAPRVADGIQNVSARLPAAALSDRPQRPALDLSPAELESMVGRVLPVGRLAAHLSYVSQKPEIDPATPTLALLVLPSARAQE